MIIIKKQDENKLYSEINDRYHYDKHKELICFDAYDEYEATKTASQIISNISGKPIVDEDVKFATGCFQHRMHDLESFQLLCRREMLEPLVYLASARNYTKEEYLARQKELRKIQKEEKRQKERMRRIQREMEEAEKL